MSVFALMFALTANASAHHPKGPYAYFGECPLSNKQVEYCIYSVTSDGAFKIGTKTVPISSPVTLLGGFRGAGEEVQFYGAENGETLLSGSEPVPGGLKGIKAPGSWPVWVQKWFNGLIKKGLTDVNASIELARPATDIGLNVDNLTAGKGTAVSLPAKIRLSNPILGDCTIGSAMSPVQINLSTGPSGALKGAIGSASFTKEYTMVTIRGAKLVDGRFAAPEATGCGGLYSYFVDQLVDEVIGLPSSPGNNSAILSGILKNANAEVVKASE